MMTNSFSEYFKQIYSYKTKEYFKEVISSFDNNNLRSATVMLYSLVICDIMFKLQELKDGYNDGSAKQILDDIDASRNSNNKSKSLWEKELLDSVHNKTSLLGDETYLNINHLYDHRNLSAHPALNDDYNLFTPNKETVAAHIKNMLEGVFIKPPIFIKVITDMLSNDLSSKKNIYENDYMALKLYLNNRYFSRMSDVMYIKIFKSFWRFVYVLENKECIENIDINNNCLRIMCEERPAIILNLVKEDSTINNININENTCLYMLLLCYNINGLYNSLSNDLKSQLDIMWDKHKTKLYLLQWFKFTTFNEYFKFVLDEFEKDTTLDFEDKVLIDSREYYRRNGRIEEYIDFCVKYFANSYNFNCADIRFLQAIEPNIKQFTQKHFDEYVKVVSENRQIYSRGRADTHNSIVVESLKDKLNLNLEYFDEKNNFYFNKGIFTIK